MGYASLVCTYLYGTFAGIKTVIESYCNVAKNILKRIDTLISTLMTTVTYTINSTMRTMINLVKQYEKELFDMLYDAVFGKDRSFWCNRLWKCAALLAELLDSDSWLNNKIAQWMKRRCMNTGAFDIMDLISQSITDFSAFQRTVCNAGFTTEFGISYIKKLFEWCAGVVDEYLRFLERNIRKIKIMAEEYLNTLIDWGVLDYLDKLLSFFTCAFDDSYSCSEIATASNFYNDSLSKLKLQKNGQGYDLSTEYKNSIYGGLEGAKNKCSNLKYEIDAAYAKCIDPDKLKRANEAYNLSKNVFPGGMSMNDIRSGRWENNHMVKRWKVTKQAYIDAWNNYKSANNKDDDITFKELLDGTYIDSEGHIYVKNGCDYIMLDEYMPESAKAGGERDFLSAIPVDNKVMLWDDEVISVAEGALKIMDNDPADAVMIGECKALYEFINGWKRNPDGVIRYNEQVI